jgi:peptidoglycan hydrolase-like protein with peptidoglycan-binding domain
MKQLLVALVISWLAVWPGLVDASQYSNQGAGPDAPERRLTKEQIRRLQARLKAEGFYVGPIDGIFNPQIEAALREYQKKNGLSQTGLRDKTTRTPLIPSVGPEDER